MEIPKPPTNSKNPFEFSEVIVDVANRSLLRPIVLSSDGTSQGETIKQQSQELQTTVYLDKGYITADEIDDDGVYRDAYVDRSVYFFAENSLRDSTCRYIKADKKDGIMSLPTAKRFSIDHDVVLAASGVDRLSSLQPKHVIEVSALASMQRGDINIGRRGKLDTTRLMYARILRDSLDQGHKLWLLNTHEALVRHLEIMLGKEQIYRLGETKEYMGSPTVPVAINPQDVVRTALIDETPTGEMKRQYLKEMLRGVSDRHLDQEMLGLLDEHDIPYERSTALKRTLRHRKALAYAGMVGYTAARAIPVANVDGFEGNAGVFFAIDFATAFPYTWGLVEVVTAKKPSRRIIGGAVAAGSFAAPYVYFWAEGNDYPSWVNGVVGGIIGVAGLMAVNGIRKDKKTEGLLIKENAHSELGVKED